MNLQIQCPACERRFRANDDLIGKTVECGACDNRFKATDKTIVHEKERFYPGEHQDALLDRLGRTPVIEDSSVNFERAQYTPQVDADAIMPSTPAQTFAALSGVALILLFAVVFFLGSGPSGTFQDVDLNKRLLLGCFVSLIGSGLIVAGAKNWRNRAILLAVVLFAGVLALILLTPVHLTPRSGGDLTARTTTPKVDEPAGLLETEQDVYLQKIGYDAVERAMKKESDVEKGIDGRDRVVAIYLSPITPSYIPDIESFFSRKLFIPPTKSLVGYEREGTNARLIVIPGIPKSFDEIAELCAELGKVDTLPEKRVINVQVTTSLFSRPGASTHKQLSDPYNELFCEANLNELTHISAERIENAVQRLGAMPADATKRHKPDILNKLISLLGQPETGDVFYSSVGRALAAWAPKDEEVAGKVGAIATSWSENNKEIPKSIVEYLISNGSPEVALIIDSMWIKNPETWSEQYQSLGAEAETRLIFHVADSPVAIKKSAAGLLRRIGTAKSLPALRAAKGKGDAELDQLLNVAITTIESP